MSTSKFLRLPNGQSIRPFMIASVSPSESGVQILGTSGNLIGFINIDSLQYNEKIKTEICDLITDSCDNKSNKISQIEWDIVFKRNVIMELTSS